MIRYQKNPKGSQKLIEVDGQKYIAKYIGKGMYSRVYRVGDRVIYYTRGDCGKEVLAQFQYDRMTHLPEIIRHENITVRPGSMWYVFSSPYYRNVTVKDKSAYKMMKKIDEAFRIFTRRYNQFEGIDFMQSIVSDFEKYADDIGIPYSVVKALQEIVDVASDCGYGVGFDLHKKNFGVNEYGTLIFRDPIYVRN